MDTSYLTPMAHNCIWIANDATDVLKSELGAECSHYRSEDAYLQGILAYVKEIEEDPEDYLDGWNLLDQTNIKIFRQKLQVLLAHIDKTIKTPIAERGKPEYSL